MEIFFKKMKRVSSCLLILAVIFMFFTTCSDFTVGGGETTLTINMGGGVTNNGEGSGRSAMPWPPTDYPGMLEQINFEVTLSGNGQTISRAAKGGDTIRASVSAGLWNVAIRAFYEGNLYAKGENSADVKTGQNNSVFIQMKKIYWYISEASELAGIASLVNNGDDFTEKIIILTADIDLSGYPNWTPIGTSAAPFRGTFDDSGYTISNLTIDTTAGYTGLFYRNNGTVKNLGIVGGSVKSSSNNTGSIAGWNYGTIENCYSTSTVTGADNVGGIAGRNEGKITNCYNTGNITGSGDFIGGIVGQNVGSHIGEISYCYNTGNITGNDIVGGISGNNQNSGTVTNNVSLGLVVTGDSTSTSISRIIGGGNTGGTNAARSDMLVNGDPVVSDTSINRHGEDIILSDTTYGNIFATWDFSASGAWEYPAGVSAATVFATGNNLPILRGFTVAQNVTMP